MLGWQFVCDACGTRCEVSLQRSHCTCGTPLDLQPSNHEPDGSYSLSYGSGLIATLPVDKAAYLRTDFLRLAPTPLVPWLTAEASDRSVWLKCDQLQGSGSYKDRGAVMLAAFALQEGAERLVVDSSGNAAAALAMFAAHVGLPCSVTVPASTPAAKLQQTQAYGAAVRVVEGDRTQARQAALAEAARGGFYAGHANSPHFHHGVKTWAYEVVAQLHEAPAMVLLPYGAGSLVMGVLLGFRELLTAGTISAMPVVHAVRKAPSAAGDTAVIASGLNADNPERSARIAREVAATGGSILFVTGAEILQAQTALAARGFHVETTSAAAWAGLTRVSHIERPGPTVVALTGSGLKERL